MADVNSSKCTTDTDCLPNSDSECTVKTELTNGDESKYPVRKACSKMDCKKDTVETEAENETKKTEEVNGKSITECEIQENGKDDKEKPVEGEGGSSPESIIFLSDGESSQSKGNENGSERNSSPSRELPQDQTEQEVYLRMLKAELRNEEAKLVLLKKLRQSQSIKDSMYSGATAAAVDVVTGTAQPQPLKLLKSQVQVPPPLVRGSQMGRSGPHPPQLHRGTQQVLNAHKQKTQSGPPPLLMASGRGRDGGVLSANAMLQQMSRSVANARQGTTPPNIVMGYQTQPQQKSASTPSQDSQTPAQRQAAAKLALRKQLEKTLLQIPPPKPPPPELNFIPSAQNAEFVYLLGLEEAVKYLTDNDPLKDRPAQPVKYVFNPFRCVQCKTDFTTVWKRDKPNSKNVICEQCVTSNQKKALKAEHTNRLKSAFVKALQQEQEIEQRIQSQAAAAAAAAASTPERTTPTSSAAAMATAAQTALSMAMNPKHQVAAQQNQLLLQAAHLGGLQLPHIGGHPLMPGFIPTTLGYPYGLIGQSHQRTAADLQRQYLLDMIPAQSMPKSNVSWKN